MKEVTNQWLKAWKNIGKYTFIVIAGVSTLGFVWVFTEYKGEWPNECWQLTATRALEPWVHFWRMALLFIAGFPTLGYTWFLMRSLEEPFFWGLREKYSKKEG